MPLDRETYYTDRGIKKLWHWHKDQKNGLIVSFKDHWLRQKNKNKKLYCGFYKMQKQNIWQQ